VTKDEERAVRRDERMKVLSAVSAMMASFGDTPRNRAWRDLYDWVLAIYYVEADRLAEVEGRSYSQPTTPPAMKEACKSKKTVRLTPGQMARALELSRDRSERLKATLRHARDVLQHAGNYVDTHPSPGPSTRRVARMVADAIDMAEKELGGL
jgi:hypothetical protein